MFLSPLFQVKRKIHSDKKELKSLRVEIERLEVVYIMFKILKRSRDFLLYT